MYITLEKKRLVFGCFLESKENVAKSQWNRFDGGVLKNLKLISISRSIRSIRLFTHVPKKRYLHQNNNWHGLKKVDCSFPANQ